MSESAGNTDSFCFRQGTEMICFLFSSCYSFHGKNVTVIRTRMDKGDEFKVANLLKVVSFTFHFSAMSPIGQ